MDKQVLKVKRLHPDAKLPTQANPNDAGFDVYAIDDGTIKLTRVNQGKFALAYVQYKTGLSIEPPEGYHVELFPRSSITKQDVVLANSIGLVDQDYRGEVIFRFKVCIFRNFIIDERTDSATSLHKYLNIYKAGDRIGQFVLRKTYHYEIQEVDNLSNTIRGKGGFGSSGV